MAPAKKHKGGEPNTDALVESPTPGESIFGLMDADAMSEEKLEGVIALMSMRICTKSIGEIMQEAGAPLPKRDAVVTRMVSEACKIYMHELIQLWFEDGADFLDADSTLSKKYRL